jgi:hypothetical protein
MNNHLKIIVILFCIALSACSGKEHPHEELNSSNAAEITIVSDTETTANTKPLIEEKSELILNTQVGEVESVRRMLREASVQFVAKDVVKTALAIDKMTFETGGFIEQKNIDFHISDIKTQKISDGKVKILEKIEPMANIIVRIPSEKATNFVNQLLPLMYFLNQQQYSAKRYELRRLEEAIDQTQSVPSTIKNSQLSEIARLTQLEVQDRVRYSTIVIHIDQQAIVRERIDIDMDAVAQLNADSFWKRTWNGVLDGWLMVLDLLVVLLTIWPLYLLLIIGVLIYRFTASLFKIK